MIKTNRICMFAGDNCSKCTMSNRCISATRITYGDRRFILSLKNRPRFTLETKQKFKEGIEKHKENQEGIKNISEYGYIKFRRDLYKHQRIRLKEVKVCSTVGLHGIIDILSVQYHKDGTMNIWIDELKTHFGRASYIQILVYVLILADINCKLLYEVPMKRKKKMKIKLGFFYPRKLKRLNIYGRVFVMTAKKLQSYWEIVVGNQFTESAGNIKMMIDKRKKERMEMMLQKIISLESVPYCTKCSETEKVKSCGWRELCGKIPFDPKLKQRFFGKSKLLIVNKPKIIT